MADMKLLLCAIALCVVALANGQQRFDHGGVTYEVITQKLTWGQAQNNCKKRGGNLVTITDAGVNNVLTNQMRGRKVGSAWHGYTDSQREGHWQWANPHGRCKRYTNWNRGEPNNNNHNEDCGQLYSTGKWNDRNCNTRLASICEYGSRALRLCVPHTPAVTYKTLIGEWYIRFVGLTFRMIFSLRSVTLNRKRIRVIVSTNARYPARLGWYSFVFGGWTYYIRKVTTGISILRMRGHHIVHGYGALYLYQSYFGGIKYEVIPEKLTWAQAQSNCKRRGGNLATITNAIRNNYLTSQIRVRKVGSAWHGYTDSQREGHWQWANPHGRCVSYTNWNRGEPNNYNHNEDCGQLSGTGKWNDLNCNTRLASICEYGFRNLRLCGDKEEVVEIRH